MLAQGQVGVGLCLYASPFCQPAGHIPNARLRQSYPVTESRLVCSYDTIAEHDSRTVKCRSRAKLVWVLAFVLAPYTHMLATVKHQTEAKLFIDGIMPQLLEKALTHVDHEAGEMRTTCMYVHV